MDVKNVLFIKRRAQTPSSVTCMQILQALIFDVGSLIDCGMLDVASHYLSILRPLMI